MATMSCRASRSLSFRLLRRRCWTDLTPSLVGRRQQLLPSWQRVWFSSYPPHEVVGLPTLSPTMESGTIAAWNLNEGDAFQPGDVFCQVETDKATVDFEAQDEGYIAKLLVGANTGQDIPVGAPIMITVEDEGNVSAFKDYNVEDSGIGGGGGGGTEAAPKEEKKEGPAKPQQASSSSSSSGSSGDAPTASPVPSPQRSSGDRVFASPLARMLATELGHDIAQIPGTGPHGRILAADVKEFVPSQATEQAAAGTPPASAAAPPSSSAPAAPTQGDGYVDYAVSEQAQMVAAQLAQSKRNVPHYYLTVDVCVDELLQLRERLNAKIDKDDANIGVYEFLIKAAALAMKTVPSANASWMESHVRVYEQVDMNVVVGSGESVYTPLIANAAQQGLRSLNTQLSSFVKAIDAEAMENGGEAVERKGGLGTFTILNLGMFGIKSCAPIIREPQSCALAVGALENRIVPTDDDEDDVLYRQSVIFTATLSCDHRVVDGAVGAQWLAAFKSLVENPQTLLL